MANILIIDDQAWVKDLCKEGLSGEGHKVSTTDDIESVRKNIFSFKPDLVLLNLYLKHGFIVWDVLRNIKLQDTNLPVLIVTAHKTNVAKSHRFQGDGYLVKSHTAASELRQKVSTLLNPKPAVQENLESPFP
jgi:DNA-binding response OmpR family regulator